jgi:predicted acyltransferase
MVARLFSIIVDILLTIFYYNLYVIGCKPAFDPENLLGTIPTIFLAYLGVQAGRIMGK